MRQNSSLVLLFIVILALSFAALAVTAKSNAREADILISDIKPVQAIWNTDLKGDGVPVLVEGKSTAVLVYMNGSDLGGLGDDQLLPVKVFYSGVPYYNDTATVGDLRALKYIPVRLKPIPHKGTGQKTIKAVVNYDNSIPELNMSNNNRTIKINVLKTRSVRVLFVPINRPATGEGYGPINRTVYSRMFNASYAFTKAVYPVADSDLIFKKYEGYIVGSQNRTRIGNKSFTWGMKADYEKLARMGDELGYDRVVGIVPRNYFTYHLGKGGPYGEAFTRGICEEQGVCRSVLVREDAWKSVAHELGHSFGLNLSAPNGPGEEYKTNPNHTGNPASGFDVAHMRPVSGICFMGGGYKNKRWWVCDDTYKELLFNLS
jgi:hypothetical protein